MLDDIVTVYTNECNFAAQLRLYQDAQGDGVAVFACQKALQSVLINAGYRVSGLEVYGSEDGETWTLITTIQHPTKDAYADYTVEMPAGTSYKYLMLDTVETQMRVTTMTFVFKK